MKLAKNVYMGNDSIAKIQIHGKVDSFNEVMMNTYATVFDALNLVLLDNDFPPLITDELRFRTKYGVNYDYKYAHFHFDQVDYLLANYSKVVSHESFINTLRGRFSVLRQLATKIKEKDLSNLAVRKVNEAEAFTLSLINTNALRYPPEIARNEFIDVLDYGTMLYIENQISQAEKNMLFYLIRLRHGNRSK